MNSWAEIILFILLGAVIGAAGAFWWLKRSGSALSDSRSATLAADLQSSRAQIASLEQQIQLVGENANVRINEYRQRLAEAQNEAQSWRSSYETRLAQLTALRERELQQKAEQAGQDESEQGKILAALAPVSQNLQDLQKRLTSLEEQRHQQFGTLSEQLKTSQRTEQQLHQATQALESALRNTSTRGQWGETQLRNIVEASGLQEQVDFLTQVHTEKEGDRLRPDMVIKLPGGKSLPVDSKVPFDSFIRANELPTSGAPEQMELRKKLLEAHVKAVRNHIDALATKDYGRWVSGSPDFTIAFLPSESLLSVALETDPTLMDYAFRKRVALTSPVSLWSVLKTISFAWQQETLTREAQEVFSLARELYDRLATLGNHTKSLGRDLSRAVDSYNRFIGSLERRVLVSARKLQAIDEDTLIDNLTAVENTPRSITDSDLLGSESRLLDTDFTN